MVPRKYPCKGIYFDESNKEDPFHANPPITAHFNGLTSWKNGRNGAIAERVGDVRFHNFKVADNLLGGIEFSLTTEYGDNTTRVDNSLIIGRSEAAEYITTAGEPYGIIGPRTEFFRVDNCRFFNFDFGEAAALSSCSHCFHPASTDHGARTTRFSKLFFDSSVKIKIKYQYPYKAIFLDEDGSLTGKGPGSWATGYYKHHEQKECEMGKDFDPNELEPWMPILCDNTVQIRRLMIYG